MKLIRETREGRQYRLNLHDAEFLRSLLQRFPITADAPAKITKTDADLEMIEREKLLNESLAEHRKELKMQAANLLSAKRFKRVEKGYWLTLKPEECEILLQILNDIRVGSWRALGEPEDLDAEPIELSERERAFYSLMNLAGYFESALLPGVHGGTQSSDD